MPAQVALSPGASLSLGGVILPRQAGENKIYVIVVLSIQELVIVVMLPVLAYRVYRSPSSVRRGAAALSNCASDQVPEAAGSTRVS